VTTIKQHFLLPGRVSIDYGDAATGPGDLVHFDLTYSMRADCFQTAGFGLRLTEFEPQPPTSRDGTWSRYRSAILMGPPS
jgi:hypothetical protein